jgi:pilus assembly protein Flp/PilA
MLNALVTWLSETFRRDEEGQGLAEYALILSLIAITVIAALIFLGGQIDAILSSIGNAL